jgi:hypothetical protein
MPIFLYSSDNSQTLKLNDNQVDTSTSLQLIGTQYFSETNPSGQILNQNFISLLQNFSCGNAPLNPILGQLWFNNSTNTFNLYDSNSWDGVIFENGLSNTNYVNTEVETEQDITNADYITSSYLTSQNYESGTSLLNFVTQITLENFNYATNSYLTNAIDSLLSNFIMISQLNTLLLTANQLSSYSFTTEQMLAQYVTSSELSGYLTTNQTVSLSGDFTGSGNTLIASSLVINSLSAGTYFNIVVDINGRVKENVEASELFITNILGYAPINPNQFLSSTLSSSGYQKFESGLIMQWITGNSDPGDNTNTSQNLNWPLSFPSMFLGATVSTSIASVSGNSELFYQIDYSATNLSNISVNRQNDSSSNTIISTPFIIGFGF